MVRLLRGTLAEVLLTISKCGRGVFVVALVVASAYSRTRPLAALVEPCTVIRETTSEASSRVRIPSVCSKRLAVGGFGAEPGDKDAMSFDSSFVGHQVGERIRRDK